jgi:streptomycin 6-kinase
MAAGTPKSPPMPQMSDDLRQRVDALVRNWNVTVQDRSETQSSFLFSGTCRDQPVVLKVIKDQGDEWHSGEVLRAFRGKGVVRVYEYVEGAMLLEQAIPGSSLASMVTAGRDDEATAILADVIHQMAGCRPPSRCPTLQDWAKGFERYIASGDDQISRDLVDDGQRSYGQLAASQGETTLLHGDLHHYNVLSDVRRGWLAVDPKGVIGEREYEAGAIFRNPTETPELFTSPKTIESRLYRLIQTLKLDSERVLRWAFAQAVLSALWTLEDGFGLEVANPAIVLATTVRAMLR